MSIHLLKTTDRAGQEVQVRLGWDRPLQGFHLTVTCAAATATHNAESEEDFDDDDEGDEERDDDDGTLYSNVSDFELLSEWGTTTPPDLEPLLKRLEPLGITLPQQMIEACLDDQACNAGNRVVRHEADGSSFDLSLGTPERPRC